MAIENYVFGALSFLWVESLRRRRIAVTRSQSQTSTTESPQAQKTVNWAFTFFAGVGASTDVGSKPKVQVLSPSSHDVVHQPRISHVVGHLTTRVIEHTAQDTRDSFQCNGGCDTFLRIFPLFYSLMRVVCPEVAFHWKVIFISRAWALWGWFYGGRWKLG